MATVKKKYYTEAFARWQESTNRFVIIVSVMHEDGTPVTGLTKSSFKTGQYFNGTIWKNLPMTTIDTDGSSHGSYALSFFTQQLSEGEIISLKSNKEFTVEVTKLIDKGENKTSFRGQCIAVRCANET